jgi:hypothetical protein
VRIIAMRAGHGQWSRARATAVRRDCLCISDSRDEPAGFGFRTAALLYWSMLIGFLGHDVADWLDFRRRVGEISA